jgi:hypothetical protein
LSAEALTEETGEGDGGWSVGRVDVDQVRAEQDWVLYRLSEGTRQLAQGPARGSSLVTLQRPISEAPRSIIPLRPTPALICASLPLPAFSPSPPL